MDQKKQALADAVILIPSLEPDHRLPEYVRALGASGFGHIVIVDDGSSEKYQPIFEEIAALDRTVVLHHDVNHGKGVALKTGYRYIQEAICDCNGVITADADGQHTVKDCVRLAEKLATGERALYLGSRDFGQKDVPFKSRFGNRTTSAVFAALYGCWLPDTQTGLRAFRKEDLQFMIEVQGNRFEYEMNVLIACARAKLKMIPVTIETVYENDNSGTHFHPLRDSYRIYKVILGSFIKFMAASIGCWVLDQGLAHLLFYVLLGLLGVPQGARSPVSTSVARIGSGVVNYLVNRSVVFKAEDKTGKTAVRYMVLWLGILIISTGVTWLGTQLGGPFWLIKLVVDILLYVVSYRLQSNWVFKEGEKAE